MNAGLFVGLQHVIPQHGLSRLVLAATRVRTPWVKNALIRGFLRLYPQVDMSEAAQSDPYRYPSFNEFFTRALAAGTRVPAGRDHLSCPVDGRVSESGAVEGDSILQAKGHRYTLDDLLAGQPWAGEFIGGSFATIYLAPFDYHRVHMPLAGTLRDTVYVPGRLFSVNGVTAARVPRLFARNERVLTLFDTAHGAVAVVLVGALNVGSMSTVWAGDITPAARREIAHVPGGPVTLEQGAELGRFNMGSTVILLCQAGRVRWDPALGAGAAVRLGQPLGTLT